MCTPSNECQRADLASPVKHRDRVLLGTGTGVGKGVEALPDGGHGGKRAAPNNFPFISGA